MINTKELEKRWYRYKAKGLILASSILVISLILIYGGYYILYKLDLNISFSDKENKPRAIMETNSTVEINSTVVESKETSVIEEKKSNDVLLAPTIPIVDLGAEKLKDSKNKKRVARERINKAKQKARSKKRLIKAKAETYLTPKELTVVNGGSIKKRETKKINLNGSSSNYMSIMKKKFETNKNSREALLIAKAYYKAGNYKNSEKWALKANNLDKKLDESWLLFAKSQEKLGKRKEALKVLVAYYRTSKSPKAKALIEKIKAKSI
jgi:tetratricopeptide (TPR) repeat protein